jgi:proton glutamate symport protein
MHKKKKNGPWKVFVAIFLGALFGVWAGQYKTLFGISYFSILEALSTIFLNSLTLVVVPLVSSSIITGIARIGSDSTFGRLGGKTFGAYFCTNLLAILTGLFFVNLFAPGASFPHDSLINAEAFDQKLLQATSGLQSFLTILQQIVPPNVVKAFSGGHMLGLIFFSLLFGYAISKIESHAVTILQNFWQGIFQTMIKITHIIMKLLPYGVFCLVAKVFSATGLHSLASLGYFSLTVLSAFFVFMFIVLPVLLKFVARVNPIRHFQAMAPALVTAFSTSSSSATLPVTIGCVEKRVGISNRICSLVVPLGTSINLSGSALYECVAALFVAQAYGVDLSLATQVLVVFLTMIASIGTAGVPGGGLVAIIIILRAIGLPSEGIGLFIAVERILDMCRSTVNVFSDSCCAVFVARSEGEQILTKDPEKLAPV